MNIDEVGRTVKGRHEVHMVLDEAHADDAHPDPWTSRRQALVTHELREPGFSHPRDRRVVVVFDVVAESRAVCSVAVPGDQISSAICEQHKCGTGLHTRCPAC